MICILPNTLSHSPDDVTRLLNLHHIRFTSLPWHPTALMLATSKDVITHLPEFAHGYFYLQNPSSLLPVLILDPRPGEQVLDLAAAPGGKTIHLAIAMHDTGVIVANDLSYSRVARMKRLIDVYGAQSVQTSTIPGQRLWMRYPDYFDRVLLDAPCTMHGTDTPSADSPQKLSKTQKWLLRGAVSACRPGGTIVYSTCTTNREENEDVIDWIMRKDGDKVELSAISHELCAHKGDLYPTITQAHGMLRIHKDTTFEGFFIARLRRKV